MAVAAATRSRSSRPPLPGQRAELSRHVLAPKAQTGGAGDPPMHEPGSREIALVEAGTVVLHIDGAAHELDEGDSVTFDADLPHHFENPGPGEAALLAVVSAGLQEVLTARCPRRCSTRSGRRTRSRRT